MGFKYNSERYRITCCKDCPDRYPCCHGKCEKYIQQKAEYDAQKAESMKKFEIAAGLYEQKCNGIQKTTRYRNYRAKYR
jgi:hypothetical protein